MPLPVLRIVVPGAALPRKSSSEELPLPSSDDGVAPVTTPATWQGLAQAGVQVIVHAGVPEIALTREELSRLFLKKVPRWPDGVEVAPVDLEPHAPARAAFTSLAHRRSVELLNRYWQRQIFSGRESPPPTVRGDAEVIAYVRATPGAIGYVSGAADVRGARGVRVVSVRE